MDALVDARRRKTIPKKKSPTSVTATHPREGLPYLRI
jgi:hypothetical protein